MATAVIMPRQGQSVESCIIGKWHKQVGDAVAVGDTLFSYETDKAAFDEAASVAGKMLAVFFKEGDDVPCLINVCVIGADGEDPWAFAPATAEAPSQEAVAPAAAPAPVSEAPAPASAPAAAAVSTFSQGAASPRAKALAATHELDASSLVGTGPDGRVIERDVEKAILSGAAASGAKASAAAAAAAASAAAPAVAVRNASESYTEKHSTIRKAIARSMHQSVSTMAQLTLNTSFDASGILAFRKRLKNANEAGNPFAPSSVPTIGDIVLFAVSRVLLAHPALNAHYDDEKMTFFKTVNLGVAIDTPRGLMVPTVFGADALPLSQISSQVKSLAADCRKGAVNPDVLKGGTFTVTNLGTFGIESFTPVINPPQTAILGVCGISQRVREGKNGAVECYSAMGLSLTIDHRAVDGAPAAKFLQELCKALENFELLLV